MENTDTVINKLDEITRRLDEIAALLNSPAFAAARQPAQPATAQAPGLVIKPDGTASGIFKIMKEPRRWNSNKGCFVSCMLEGTDTDEWYSIGITDNVANKVAPGFVPQKGDIISVSGKYEEQTEADKTYRSVFAYKVRLQSGVMPPPARTSSVGAANNTSAASSQDDGFPF